jgi:hypothetical protein
MQENLQGQGAGGARQVFARLVVARVGSGWRAALRKWAPCMANMEKNALNNLGAWGGHFRGPLDGGRTRQDGPPRHCASKSEQAAGQTRRSKSTSN